MYFYIYAYVTRFFSVCIIKPNVINLTTQTDVLKCSYRKWQGLTRVKRKTLKIRFLKITIVRKIKKYIIKTKNMLNFTEIIFQLFRNKADHMHLLEIDILNYTKRANFIANILFHNL